MIRKYRCRITELTELIDSIDKTFEGRDVEITVSDEGDETSYLLSTEANRRNLENSIRNIEQGNVITMTLQEFEERYGRQ